MTTSTSESVPLAVAGALVRPYRDIWPNIHPDAWLAPGAMVVGDVEIGAESSVWYGSLLRGDVNAIRIGSRTNVQDHSIVHVTRDRFSCVLGDEVTVGHRAVVHGCRVGSGALVGIGAIVLDGAEVGERAWIGAGALVAPGARIPDGVLAIGVPAVVKRDLSVQEMESQRERTLQYVETARQHAEADAR